LSAGNAPSVTCLPKKALRCWQYVANPPSPVPRWVLPHLCWSDDEKGPEFIDSGGSSGDHLTEGCWLVELDDGTNSPQYVWWYTDEEFQQQFEVRP
jgi:hypothetical protein